jgi:eukaryotic-like serine/threonine-protein kinase
MIAHARDPVTPPSQLEPGIPADLEAVILRCLEKHPSRRYANVRELRTALEKCSVSGQWTQERAAQWWKLRSPALLAGGNLFDSSLPDDEELTDLNVL